MDTNIQLSVDGTNFLVTAKSRPVTTKIYHETYYKSVLQKIDVTDDHIQALVVVPTQIIVSKLSAVCQELAKQFKINLVVSNGELTSERFVVKGQILIALCSRIRNLMNASIINLSKCKVLVLDAVLDLFPPSSGDAVKAILKQMPKTVDTFLYSTVFPLSTKELMELPRVCSLTQDECHRYVNGKYTATLLRQKSEIEKRMCSDVNDLGSEIIELKGKEFELQAEVTELKGREIKLQAEVTRLKGRVIELLTEVTGSKDKEIELQAEATELKDNKVILQAEVTRLKGREIELLANEIKIKAELEESKVDFEILTNLFDLLRDDLHLSEQLRNLKCSKK